MAKVGYLQSKGTVWYEPDRGITFGSKCVYSSEGGTTVNQTRFSFFFGLMLKRTAHRNVVKCII